MKKFFIFSVLFLSWAPSQADVVCTGMTQYGAAKVTISSDEKTVTVSGGELTHSQVFTGISEKHGILTAPGLAVFYENDYGILRNATIITSFSHDVGDDPNDAGYVDVLRVTTCSESQAPGLK